MSPAILNYEGLNSFPSCIRGFDSLRPLQFKLCPSNKAFWHFHTQHSVSSQNSIQLSYKFSNE
jgi:hypothetical protein